VYVLYPNLNTQNTEKQKFEKTETLSYTNNRKKKKADVFNK